MTISGFTFVHNAIDSGYPIVEAIAAVQPYVDEIVVVDMQSTDSTREVLERLQEKQSPYVNKYGDVSRIRILDGIWDRNAGETLRQAHAKYIECADEIILHFEADEVYSPELLKNIIHLIGQGVHDIAVHRLQLEQNFQRCRWYPEPVHRVFPRLSHTRKDGHTTDRHQVATLLPPESGYLWDITNCFRDNWLNRVNKQAEMRASEPQYLMVPLHTMHKAELSEAEAQKVIYSGRHWQWKSTPFDIPDILKPLVGVMKYEPRV